MIDRSRPAGTADSTAERAAGTAGSTAERAAGTAGSTAERAAWLPRLAGVAGSGGVPRTRVGSATALARPGIASARDLLAAFLSLDWARVGTLSYAAPVAMILVAIHFGEQMPALVAGVPFWLASLGFVALAVVIREVAVRGGATRAAAVPSRWLAALAGEVVGMWLLYDILYLGSQRHLYDVDVYLGAAGRWMDGGQPYLTQAISVWPISPAADYFLYPPPLLPFFGLLSRLPHEPTVAAWVGILIVAGYAAYRLLGIRPIYSLLMLAFPPMFIGIESGNVAPIAFLLFVAGGRAAGLLPVDSLFKVQNAIPALWLVRERRWKAAAAGAAGVATLVLVTIPVTGLRAWSDWFGGLTYRAESQAAVPEWFGMSFAHYLPGTTYMAIGVTLVAIALLISGRRGLAALGIASIWASPALWPHGFLFALPAILFAESPTLIWLVIGAGAVSLNAWYLFYAGGLVLLAASRPRVARPLHPLGGANEPWGTSVATTAAVGASAPGATALGASDASTALATPRPDAAISGR